MTRLSGMNTEIQIGQVWEDCDKRMRGRRCRVVGITSDGKVVLQNIAGRVPATKVAIRRMYPHSTGWKLVE